MTMTVAQYANKVGIAVDGILSLRNMLGIQVNSDDDVLSEEDVLLLDNAIKEMHGDNNSNFGGGGGSGAGGGEIETNMGSPSLDAGDQNTVVSDVIQFNPEYVKNAMQCLKNMQLMEENPNYGMIGEQISSNRYNIESYTSEVDSKTYTEMATSLLYYTAKSLDEGFDFGLYDDDYSLEEYYEKMFTGEFNDENGVFDEELAQEYLKNVDLGTEEENWYYTGEFYSKLLNGDFHDENGVYSEELAQEYFNGVSAIIENNNRIRAEERNQIYDDVIVSVGNNYDRKVERYNNRVLEKEKEINEIDNQIAGLQAEIDKARGINVTFNPFVSSSDTMINLRDVNGIDEKEKQLAELQQQRTDLINESIELKNQRDEFFVDSLAIHTMARDFETVSSVDNFTIDPKYSDNYRYLTPEEQKVAIYLQNTGRDGKLGQFFGLKQNYFNQMLAQEEAQVVIDNVNYLITKENNAGGRIDSWQEFFNVVGKSMQNAVAGTPGETLATNEEQVFQYLVGVGFVDGINNFDQGLKNLISADGVPSVEQYKTGYIVEGLKEVYGADGLFGGNAFTSVYEISSSIGNMAPAMAISAVTTALTKNIAVGAKVGEILGTTAMGLSAAGNAREQGLQQGMTNIQAWNYGLMSGSSEAAIGYVLGGIPFLSRMDDMPGVKGYFCKMIGEGIEEGLQSILEPMFVAVATNNEYQFDFNSIDWNEVWKSGVYGAITAGILNGANLLQSATPNNIVKNEIGNIGYYLNEQVANDLTAKYKGKDFTDPLVLDEFRSDLEAAVGLDGNSVVLRIGNVEYAISKNLANQIIDKYGNVDTTKRSVMNQVTAEIENTPGVISTELADAKTKKGVYYVGDGGETIISSIFNEKTLTHNSYALLDKIINEGLISREKLNDYLETNDIECIPSKYRGQIKNINPNIIKGYLNLVNMDINPGGFVIKGYEILDFLREKENVKKLFNTSKLMVYADYSAKEIMYSLIKIFQEYDKLGLDVKALYPHVSEIYDKYSSMQNANLLSTDIDIINFVHKYFGYQDRIINNSKHTKNSMPELIIDRTHKNSDSGSSTSGKNGESESNLSNVLDADIEYNEETDRQKGTDFAIEVDGYKLFSKDFTTSIRQMGNHFGDAGINNQELGKKINNLFLQGKTASMILSELDGNDKVEFENYINNTIEGRFLAKIEDPDLIKAVSIYTRIGYNNINSALRTGNLDGNILYTDSVTKLKESVSIKKLVESIDKVISLYGGLDSDTILYRAVGLGAFTEQNETYRKAFESIQDKSDVNEIYGILRNFVGFEFSDKGYMSTSPGYNTSLAKKPYPVVLEILAKEGTPGAYINQISKQYNVENEFLLDKGTTLKIVEVKLLDDMGDYNAYDRVVVRCEVVPIDSSIKIEDSLTETIDNAVEIEDRIEDVTSETTSTVFEEETQDLDYFDDTMHYLEESSITSDSPKAKGFQFFPLNEFDDIIVRNNNITKENTDNHIEMLEHPVSGDNIDSTLRLDNNSFSDIEIGNVDDINQFLDNIESFDEQKIFDDVIKKLTDYFNNKVKVDSIGAYYDLLSLSGYENFNDRTIRTKILVGIISSSSEIRQAIYEQASQEIQSCFASMFDDNVPVEDILNSLLGKSFIEKGIGIDHDWDNFISIIKDGVFKRVQNGVNDNKQVTLWSYVDTSVLNKIFTTIDSVTIGGMYFLEDLVYCNWDNDTINCPKMIELWEKLSNLYADACCQVIDNNTGEKINKIKFVCPYNDAGQVMFGKLFKQTEFGSLLKNGSIDIFEITQAEILEVDSETEGAYQTEYGSFYTYFEKRTIEIDFSKYIKEYNSLIELGYSHEKAVNELIKQFEENVNSNIEEVLTPIQEQVRLKHKFFNLSTFFDSVVSMSDEQLENLEQYDDVLFKKLKEAKQKTKTAICIITPKQIIFSEVDDLPYDPSIDDEIDSINEALYRGENKELADGNIVIRIGNDGDAYLDIPSKISEYQYRKLKKFNMLVKEHFSNEQKIGMQVVNFTDYSEESQNNIDNILENIDDSMIVPDDSVDSLREFDLKLGDFEITEDILIKYSDLIDELNKLLTRSDNNSLDTPKIISKFVVFSKQTVNALNQLSNYFGDAGETVNKAFLSLKTATEILHSLNGKNKIEFQHFLENTLEGRFLSKLNSEQIKCLITYTGGFYETINKKLREIKGNIKDIEGTVNGIKLKSIIENIDEAIKKFNSYAKFNEPMVMYRGVDINSFIGQNELYERLFYGIDSKDLYSIESTLKMLVGKKITDYGYMSASPGYNQSFANKKPIVLEIITPAGTPGAYINQISKEYNFENEYIFARNTTFRILEVFRNDELNRVIVRCIVDS